MVEALWNVTVLQEQYCVLKESTAHWAFLIVVIQQVPPKRIKENEAQDISCRELEPPNDNYVQPLERDSETKDI